MIQERLSFLSNIQFRDFKNHFEQLKEYQSSEISISRTIKYSICVDDDISAYVRDMLTEINYLLVPMDTICPILEINKKNCTMIGNSSDPQVEWNYLTIGHFYLGIFYCKQNDTLELSIKLNIKKDI